VHIYQLLKKDCWYFKLYVFVQLHLLAYAASTYKHVIPGAISIQK